MSDFDQSSLAARLAQALLLSTSVLMCSLTYSEVTTAQEST